MDKGEGERTEMTMAATCIHCHKPADKRCGNVLDLPNGDRLHRACLTPHLLMVVGVIPDPAGQAWEAFGMAPSRTADEMVSEDGPSRCHADAMQD